MRKLTSTTIVSLGIFLFSAAALGQTTETPAVAAARNRQAIVKTLEVEFELTEVIPRNGMSQFSATNKAKAFPDKEVTIKSVNRFILDGGMLRYENNHPIWNDQSNSFHTQSFISVLNASSAKQYYPDGMLKSGLQKGVILRNAKNIDVKSYALMPLTTAFRGLDPAISPYVISTFRAEGETRTIRNSVCEGYTKASSKDTNVIWYLDPTKEYSISRMERRTHGRITDQVDIVYREDSTCKWAPQSWTRTGYSQQGVIWRISTATVTAMRINQPQERALFDVRYPPGTHVYDQNAGKSYRVQSNGTMRQVDDGTGEELSAIAHQPGTPWHQRLPWFIIGLVAAGFLSVYYLMRRIRKANIAR